MNSPDDFINSVSPRQDAQKNVPAALMDSLELSKAQAEACITVPLNSPIERLEASIARMKAKGAGQT